MDNRDAEIWNKSGREGVLLEAKRADRPIKNWPLLTPVTSPGKLLAHSHTCYYRLYCPEAGETKRERECQEKMYACAFFTLYCTSAEWNWGRVCTFFFTIACKCNSGSEKREEDLNRLYSWDIPFSHTFGCPSGVKSRQENGLTGVRAQIFLSVYVNGTVNVSIRWIGHPVLICFFFPHTSVCQSQFYDVIFQMDSRVFSAEMPKVGPAGQSCSMVTCNLAPIKSEKN